MASHATDQDLDGLSDQDETILYHTNPTSADTDSDGYGDYQEIYHGFSPLETTKVKLNSLDSDHDGVPDSWEIRLKTDLLKADTDGDGFSDGEEIISGHDPLSANQETIKKEIKVDLKTQRLTYSFNSIELESFLISSGIKSMPTPTGDFFVLDKVPIKVYGGKGYNFYYPNTKWNLHFYTGRLGYYIHGAYWHHNFGHPMSHGCVNVSYADMERLYAFAQVGTAVHIQ